ncbi:MAG: Uncharacterised protein [Glaciecola sp. HTCC2999]|jgi:hypothetical protein|nr:MAG: Uncharacterised protein [Glaciecola sp. HTCC2999]
MYLLNTYQYPLELTSTELSLPLVRLIWKAKETKAWLNNMVSSRGDSK